MNQKFISFIKLLCIVYLIIFIPKIISDKSKTKGITINRRGYLSSIENLLKNKRSFVDLKKHDLALVTDLQEVGSTNILLKNGFKIKKVFVLNETGQILNKFSQIKKINTPVFKLNNLSNDEFANQFKSVDGIIFNVKNSGSRNDNCFNTLLQTMQYAQEKNKNVIVLDQPNPLSRFMEGPGAIPMQHGLTVGELSKYFNNYSLEGLVKLTIIPMIGWQRANDKIIASSLYQEHLLTVLNQIDPITLNVSSDNNNFEKRFTNESILFPKDSLSLWETDYLKKIFNKLGFYCKDYSYYNKNKNKYFKGIRLSIKSNLNKFSSFNAMLTLTRFLKNRKNIKLGYSDSFDKMLGSSDTKEFLNNKISFEELRNNTKNSLNDFYSKSKKILLYKPCPLINDIKIIKS